MRVESIDKDLRSLLESGFYLVPRFQRPYRWDRDNVEEFWDDTVRETEGEHFIGAIVVYKVRSQDQANWAVVDGQQRLTTITMILCALRDRLGQEGFAGPASGAGRGGQILP